MELNIETLLTQAREAIQSNHLQEAGDICRAALAMAPDHPGTLHMAGLALALQHEPRQALPYLQRAAQLQPSTPEFLFDLAHLLRDMDELEEAASHYRRTMKLAPAWAAPWINLGSVLIDQGKPEEAIDLLQRGIKIFPGDADLANALGNALGRKGYHQEALTAYRQAALHAPARVDILHNQAYTLHTLGNHAGALALVTEGLRLSPGDVSLKMLAGSILQQYRPQHPTPDLSNLLSTALAEGWAETAALSSTGWHLLELDPEFSRAATDPGQWAEGGEFLPSHPLLLSLLRNGLVNHPHWEIRLTQLRKALLDDASASRPLSPDRFELAEALAEQCFHNEYLFAQTEDEENKIGTLAQRISDGALPEEALQAAIAAYAAYRPLNTLPAATLLGESLLTPLAPLFQQQVFEPQEEARIAASLSSLTPIDPGLSHQVRQQYEENPYPRWKTVPLLRPVGSPNRTLAALFPGHTPFSLPESPKILIAGTGTGLNAILTARRFPKADILAIDLSRASLAYAARKAKELGHANIRFAQADILNLNACPERFHIIESVGVLHHMDDTLGAWRILSELLVQGGVMKIGLYSRLGRSDLKPLQERIHNQRLSGTPREIRAMRAQALASDAPPHWAAVTARHDFYTLSTCRDLLFHVHEREFDLGDIARMVEALKLQFLGFELSDPTALRSYQEAHPNDPGRSDLKLWHHWEQTHPAQFSGMYQFWVRRQEQHPEQ
jgi:tetratricopeptide (TPR) repeat protein/SAM-dependent methyltransferase